MNCPMCHKQVYGDRVMHPCCAQQQALGETSCGPCRAAAKAERDFQRRQQQLPPGDPRRMPRIRTPERPVAPEDAGDGRSMATAPSDPLRAIQDPYRRGAVAAKVLRRRSIAAISEIVDKNLDEADREPERVLRRWILERLIESDRKTRRAR